MIDQDLFDALADALVDAGRPVSYTTMQDFLEAHRGYATSDRDLKAPYGDWCRRRRYKAHFAVLDLPEQMEKAIAKFAMLAMGHARDRAEAEQANVVGEIRDRVAELEQLLAQATERNAVLERGMAELRLAPGPRAAPAPPAEAAARRAGRKRGTSVATSRFFWDKVVRELAALIRREGPQNLDDLFASIGQDARDLAAAAFRPINARSLEKALAERTARERHRLTKLDDGRYGLLPRRRRAAR